MRLISLREELTLEKYPLQLLQLSYIYLAKTVHSSVCQEIGLVDDNITGPNHSATLLLGVVVVAI